MKKKLVVTVNIFSCKECSYFARIPSNFSEGDKDNLWEYNETQICLKTKKEIFDPKHFPEWCPLEDVIVTKKTSKPKVKFGAGVFE